MRDTAFKRALKDLPIGTELKLDAPYGDFKLRQTESTPAVFITGGIGVTPGRSMIAQATHDKDSPQDHAAACQPHAGRSAAEGGLREFGQGQYRRHLHRHPCPRHVDSRYAARRHHLTAAQAPWVEQRASLARTFQKSESRNKT